MPAMPETSNRHNAALPLPADDAEYGANLDTARTVRDQVRHSLRFDESYWKRKSRPKIDDIFAPKGTSCYGYTFLYSQELKNAGVEHMVGVVNTHATVVLPTLAADGQRGLWLMDPLSSRIDEDLSTAFEASTVPLEETSEAAQSGKRVAMIIDGSRIAVDMGPTFAARADTSPWLVRGDSTHSALRKGSSKLFLSLFEAQAGQTVLLDYAHFREAMRDSDLELASASLLNMAGQFPDIDISGRAPRQVRTVVRQLVLAGRQEQAMEVTDAFYDSFTDVQEDTRVNEYKADCMRYIATVGNKSNGFSNAIDLRYRLLHEQARAIYEGLLDNPRSCRSSIPGKLATSRTMYESE